MSPDQNLDRCIAVELEWAEKESGKFDLANGVRRPTSPIPLQF